MVTLFVPREVARDQNTFWGYYLVVSKTGRELRVKNSRFAPWSREHWDLPLHRVEDSEMNIAQETLLSGH